MGRGIESLFPLAGGIIVLLVVAAALLAATVPVAVCTAGILYFGGGYLFGGSGWSPGISLLVPFLALSAFLVFSFGLPFLILPLIAGGGVAAGDALRRSGRKGAGLVVVCVLWLVLVACVACAFAPGQFNRLNPH